MRKKQKNTVPRFCDCYGRLRSTHKRRKLGGKTCGHRHAKTIRYSSPMKLDSIVRSAVVFSQVDMGPFAWASDHGGMAAWRSASARGVSIKASLSGVSVHVVGCCCLGKTDAKQTRH